MEPMQCEEIFDEMNNNNDKMNVENLMIFNNVSTTTVSKRVVVNNASTLAFPLKQSEKQCFLIDGMNVLKHETDGRYFNDLHDLDYHIKAKLVPLLILLGDSDIHLILKSFRIGYLSSEDVFRYIITLLQANLKKEIKMTLYFLRPDVVDGEIDNEIDDRFLWLLKFRLYKEGIIISNDKFRSLGKHYDRAVKYYEYQINLNDPMQIEMKYEKWIQNMSKEFDTKKMKFGSMQGIEEEELVDKIFNACNYQRKGYQFCNDKAILC